MKKYYSLLLIIFIVSGLSGTGFAAPVYNPSTGHMYDVVFGDWYAAESNAIALGGHLVTINNQEEQDWLVQTFGSNTYYWIGLNDVKSDNHYEWASGEAVTYTNWESWDNNSDWYDWITMNYGGAGKWNYFCLPCASSGIAEWQANPVPEPATFMLIGLGLITIVGFSMHRRLKPG